MSQINASNNNSVSGLSSSFTGNTFSPLNNGPGQVDTSLYGGLSKLSEDDDNVVIQTTDYYKWSNNRNEAQ